jgi:hypothetical protein
MYLPKKMRGNAETLIKDKKARFLDLLKIDVPIPKDMSILAAKHLDKGDDIESQYYKYRENIIKNEKNMNHNYMRCLSFFYNCCSCFYKPSTTKKILDNRDLERIIKYSKMENESKYKRRAYQYTLSSIMLNNVKNEYNEVKALGLKQAATVQDTSTTTNINADLAPAVEKTPLELKIEETVATVTNKVSGLMTPKKKDQSKPTQREPTQREPTQREKKKKKKQKKKQKKKNNQEQTNK